jgi:hypothetical protein
MQGAIKRRVRQCGNGCRTIEGVRDLVEVVACLLKIQSDGYSIWPLIRISHFDRSIRKCLPKIDRQVRKERFERGNDSLIRRRMVIGLDGNGYEIVFDPRRA